VRAEFEAMNPDEIRENALKHAVNNAASYEGRAQVGPVVGKILGEFPELRPRSQEVVAIVKKVVSEVNSWTIELQRSTLEERWPELLETRRKEEKKTLPPLENVGRFEMVKTRFAPNPDGALHLGSAEPIIFCDEYAKMYDGHFILRYEDTSAEV
jgi:glutamyl-tRNA synthetase